MSGDDVRFVADGRRLTLRRETRAWTGRILTAAIPVAEWAACAPVAARPALAQVLAAIEDGLAGHDGAPLGVIEGDAVILHPELVAQLGDGEAAALGLPPATPFVLEMTSRGLLHRGDFRIETHWRPLAGYRTLAEQIDGFLHHDGAAHRIPAPLLAVMRAVDAVNAATDMESREEAFADLKEALGPEGHRQIRPDGLISRLRVAYAGAFSLRLREGEEGLELDPVLFARRQAAAAASGATLDEGEDSLLPPRLAAGFERRFRRGDGTRRTYLLDDGTVLFLAPRLRQALGVVRRAQSAPDAVRRAFAASPGRHLGPTSDDEPDVFIETGQYSERVAGIDLWRRPVLPWIKPSPSTWLPERFGLRIGEGDDAVLVYVDPAQIDDLHATAANAVNEGRTTFVHAGQTIPATQAALSAIDDLRAITACRAAPRGTPPPALAGRYFLQVRDNLADISYAPLSAAVPRATAPAQIPPTVLTAPKPHQVEGFRWLTEAWRAGLPGVVLADDMGLGKTFQALAFLAWLRAAAPGGGAMLIVAPTGLLANWQEEARRHLAPDTLGPIVAVHGAGLADMRKGPLPDTLTGAAGLDTAGFDQAGLVLTTYETLRDYHMSFARHRFAAVLYDEAQKLKNPSSQLTRAAKTLNAGLQLALTGTPVENRLQDLWSIFDVVHPGLFGSSRQFEEQWPAREDRLRALHARLTQAQDGRPPVLLRRMKDECLSALPARHIRAMPIAMPPRQQAAYERAIARGMAARDTHERGRMLEVLHQLRGVSLHPVAPEDSADHGDYFAQSARLTGLFSVLDEVAAKGEKALVFCESLAMQALIALEVGRRYRLRHAVARIHGGVPGGARQALVDAFQSRPAGFDCMMLSPKAGGVGLTLTAANHVIHLSRWWNPAVEDQASDRAYRIGQTREVFVYLPQAVHPALGEASFDLRLDALMTRKRELARGLLAPGDDGGNAAALFSSVMVEPPAPAPPAPEPAPPPQPAPRPSRLAGILSVRRPTVPSAPAPALHPTWPTRVKFEAGGTRDRTIFTAPLVGDPPRDLVIIDPYAAGSAASRRHVPGFARMLIGDGSAVRTVRLIAFDADSANDPVGNDHQFDDMHQQWRNAFPSGPDLVFEAVSKRGNREMHDREVRVTTQAGRELVWDLGRGIDGVMTNTFGSRVNLTEL